MEKIRIGTSYRPTSGDLVAHSKETISLFIIPLIRVAVAGGLHAFYILNIMRQSQN
jgi:hypothetical protein